MSEHSTGAVGVESMAGRELGGYRLERCISAGGIAAVYEAASTLDSSIKRAIKVIRPEFATRDEFVSRFLEEARILDKLRHDHILRFYGVRREAGVLFMELELLEGEPLDELLRHHPERCRSLLTAVNWISEAAEATAAAHDLGVVHRDLKPSNFLVSPEGTLKVLDFGIARALDEADRAMQITRAGHTPGSPAYMAPEVCNGSVPEQQADVYALGISLYELLLGHHPFNPPDQTPLSTLQLMNAQVTRELAPLREHRPDAPAALEDIVARATEKDPTRRYGSARELADALREITSPPQADSHVGAREQTDYTSQFESPTSGHENDGQQTSAPSVSTPEPERLSSRKTLMMAAAGVVLVALLAGGGWIFTAGQEHDADGVAEASTALNAGDVGGECYADGTCADGLACESGTCRKPTPGAPQGYSTIPAGTFTIGSPPSENGRDDDEKQYQVTMSRHLWLKTTEVTQGEWNELMGNNPSYFKACGDDCPVERVNWYEAVTYLNKLSNEEGLEACYETKDCSGTIGDDYECSSVRFKGLSCDGYRLPTEVEWEYAARASSDGPRHDKLDRIAWHKGNSEGKTHPVGRKASNASGLHDVIGNVGEWTGDWYANPPPSGLVTDPQGASTGDYRVNRGCSWKGFARHCRVAHRGRHEPSFRSNVLGFRTARTVTP